MIESIKHFFGLCGENHPSVLWVLFGYIPGIPYIIYRIKNKLLKKN